MKASSRLAILTLALLPLLAGCVPAPSITSTPTNEKVAPQYQRYYSQALSWAGCGSGMECATVFAPLDWSAPNQADDISLALVRHRATGSREGSLFVNPGGPGASGFNFVHDSVDFAVSRDLQSRFDIVGWDPRGVGRSTAVQCYDGPQLDTFLFSVPSAPVDSPAYAREVTSSAKQFADACLQKTGRLLQFIDTVSTVQDLDMMRAVVGDRSLNFFGLSYGSDIGARYADRYPAHVGRVTLDGATDSALGIFDVTIAQTKAFADALRSYLAACLAASGCPFRGTVEDAIVQIRDMGHRLDKAPLRGADGRMLTSAYLRTAIQLALYDQGAWKTLTTAFTEIQSGGSDTAFMLADMYVDRDKNGNYTSNVSEAFLAIMCLDYPVETDPAVLARQRDALAAADPVAEPSDLDALGNVVCQQWPYKAKAALPPVRADGAAPIVVVGTTGDPATPYQWAQALSHELASGVLVTYVGQGHAAYHGGDPCVVGAVDKYFIDGTVPQNGLVCKPS